jgi:tetratricopeptide (TPR) repeat protein
MSTALPSGAACRKCREPLPLEAVFCAQCGLKAGASLTLEEFRERLAAAQNLFRSGQTENAEAGLQLLLTQEVEDVRLAATYSCLGTIYLRTQRVPDSIAAFYAAVRHAPRVAGAYVKLGEACRAGGLLREAIECFHVATRLDAGCAPAVAALRETQQQRDESVRALSAEFPALRAAPQQHGLKEHCRKILALDPHHLVAGNLMTEIWENEGEEIAALRLSKVLARKFPQATAFSERCRRLEAKAGARCRALEAAETARRSLQKGDLDGAVATACRAVEADATEPEALVTLALALEAKGQDTESKRLFQAALKIDAQLKTARAGAQRVRQKELARQRKVVADVLGKASELRRAQEYSQALGAIRNVASLLPDDPLIPFLEGQIHSDQNNLFHAAASFERAVGGDDVFVPALRALVGTRLKIDRELDGQVAASLKQAKTMLGDHQAAKREELLMDAKKNLATRRGFYTAKKAAITNAKHRSRFLQQEYDCYEAIGKHYEQCDHLARAVEEYAVLSRLQPRNADAKKLWQSARERQQQIVKTHIERATRFRTAKDYDKAIREIERALEVDPRSAAALLHLGAAFECARQFDKALEIYDQTQSLYPASESVQKQLQAARERIKKRKQAQNLKTAKTAAKLARIAIRLAG